MHKLNRKHSTKLCKTFQGWKSKKRRGYSSRLEVVAYFGLVMRSDWHKRNEWCDNQSIFDYKVSSVLQRNRMANLH